MNEIQLYLSYYCWLVSFGITSSRFIHTVANEKIPFLYMAESYSKAYAHHIFFIHSFFRSIIISQYSQNHLFYQIQKFLTIERNRQSPHLSSKYLLVPLVYISRVLPDISGLFELIFRNHFLGFSDINQCGKVVFLNSPTTKYLYVPKYLTA